MRSGSNRTALSLIRIRASGSRRSARAPIGRPSARSARPSRRRNSTRRSPPFGRRRSRRRSKLSPLLVRAVRPHALAHERAGASFRKMRSRDVDQGLCESRSGDRQGRAVAAPDRNCASSGFPRRSLCPPTTRAKSSARFATGSARFSPKSSSSGSPGRRSRRNRGRGDGSAGPSLSWLCAAIGSVTTLLLSASHTAPQYAVGSMAPPPSGQAAPSIEAPSPGSQSTGAPATSSAAPAAPPTGPATFGLHEQ